MERDISHAAVVAALSEVLECLPEFRNVHAGWAAFQTAQKELADLPRWRLIKRRESKSKLAFCWAEYIRAYKAIAPFTARVNGIVKVIGLYGRAPDALMLRVEFDVLIAQTRKLLEIDK